MILNKSMKNILILIIPFLLFSVSPAEPDRFEILREKLETFSKTNVALNETVELSVNGADLSDFIRMISKNNELNISLQEGITGSVVNDFNNASVKDVFIYLCKEYKLDIEFIGNILFFKKYIEPVKKIEPVVKKIDVSYNDKNKFLSLNLKGDDVSEVAKVISKKSGNTVVVYPKARGVKLNSFIQNRPFEQVLEKMASSNGLIVNKTKDGFYIINKEIVQRKSNVNGSSSKNNSNEQISIAIKDDLFSIEANDAPISDIIMSLSEKLNVNYFFYGFPTEKTTLFIDNMTYEEFLAGILVGTKYTYKKADEVYLIGERKKEGFRSTELISLKNRSIEKVLPSIPQALKDGLDVKEFNELNGLVVSGASEQILELKNFVEAIDVVVPVVTIDLIIVEVNKSNGVNAGIESGIGTSPNTTTSNGTTTPGVNINLSTNAINNLLQSINGLGLFNLGNVTPNFYMNIQALETNQVLKIKSTPKIATLNGELATLSIGNQEYYLENNNQVVNTGVNQTLLQTQVYKKVEANMTVTIKPFVSEDEQISLTIEFEQATFTPRISETAPPGQKTRSFNSVIRVKNDDMVLLGGLEEETSNNSGSGVPGLSRIPILKWFFGKRVKEKSKTKLHIFIRPHVSY